MVLCGIFAPDLLDFRQEKEQNGRKKNMAGFAGDSFCAWCHFQRGRNDGLSDNSICCDIMAPMDAGRSGYLSG